jgi:hypothetical protein
MQAMVGFKRISRPRFCKKLFPHDEDADLLSFLTTQMEKQAWGLTKAEIKKIHRGIFRWA